MYQAAAAVELLSEDPVAWVPTDVIASLRFLLAGTMSETALLEHAIEDGYREDFNIWRRGLGKTDAMTRTELDELAGGNFLDELNQAEEWAKLNQVRIERLAGQLAELSRPGSISYENVVALVQG